MFYTYYELLFSYIIYVRKKAKKNTYTIPHIIMLKKLKKKVSSCVNFAWVSMIFLLDFGTVLTVWYFLLFTLSSRVNICSSVTPYNMFLIKSQQNMRFTEIKELQCCRWNYTSTKYWSLTIWRLCQRLHMTIEKG